MNTSLKLIHAAIVAVLLTGCLSSDSGGGNQNTDTGGNGGGSGNAVTLSASIDVSTSPHAFWSVTLDNPLERNDFVIGNTAATLQHNQTYPLNMGNNTILNSGVALTAGDVVHYPLTLTASGVGADLRCFTQDTLDEIAEDYRVFSKTLAAGANSLAIQCRWLTTLPIEVRGLPSGSELTLRASYVERGDRYNFGATRTIEQLFTGTGSDIQNNYYLDFSSTSGLGLSISEHQVTGMKILETELTGIEVDTSEGLACTVAETYNLWAAGTRTHLTIDCERNNYMAAARLKAFTTNGSTTPFEPVNGQHFGSVLAMTPDGNWLVVGHNHSGTASTGERAYLFRKVNGAWTNFAELFSSNSGSTYINSNYGRSVAIAVKSDGYPVVAIGVPGADLGNAANLGSGRVDILSFYGGGMNDYTLGGAQASLTHAHAGFGSSVALSSDGRFLAVGAPGDLTDFSGISTRLRADASGDLTDPGGIVLRKSAESFWPTSVRANSLEATGAVYVFQADGSDNMNWEQVGLIKPGYDQIRVGKFGASVAFNADATYLLVGAPEDTNNLLGVHAGIPVEAEASHSNQKLGSATLYSRDTTTNAWAERAYIKPRFHTLANGGVGNDQLAGSLVALSEVDGWLNLVVVANNGQRTSSFGSNQYLAWVYRTQNTEGNGVALLGNPTGVILNSFNYKISSIALAANTHKLAIGQVPNGASTAGRVDVWDLTSTGQAWREVRRPETFSGLDTSGQAQSVSIGNFGAAVALNASAASLVVSAANESCGIVEPTDLNPVECGTWTNGTWTGSAYIFD